MKIDITVQIDNTNLEYIIKSLIINNIKINKKSIVDLIKSTVRRKGIELFDYPETWIGCDDFEFDDLIVKKYVDKYIKIVK